MRYWYRSLWLLLIVLALVGCADGKSSPVPAVTGSDTYVSAVLNVNYADALTVRNQLALGILNLEGTANETTSEQGKSLLLLW